VSGERVHAVHAEPEVGLVSVVDYMKQFRPEFTNVRSLKWSNETFLILTFKIS
jgi:hypothetical protein